MMIIGVFSAKGGVGKSLVASNLAAAFAALHRLPTVLFDLAPGLGHTDLLLDLTPERTWADLLPVIQELNSKHLELATLPHTSGMRLLAAPAALDPAARLTPQLLKPLLAALRQNFAHIVLDCPTGLDPSTQAAFLEADLRLVVLTLDAPTLRNTQRMIQSLPTDGKAVGLVINQYFAGAPVGLDEVLASLSKGLPKAPELYAVLPVDARAVWENVSYGQPCVLARKKGLGKALRLLAARIVQAR